MKPIRRPFRRSTAPASGCERARDDPEDRRLARAVGADEADRLALLEAERRRVQHAAPGEGYADVVKRYKGHG